MWVFKELYGWHKNVLEGIEGIEKHDYRDPKSPFGIHCIDPTSIPMPIYGPNA